MINRRQLNELTIYELQIKYPFVKSFFTDNKLDVEEFEDTTFISFLEHFTEEERDEWAIDTTKLIEDVIIYINNMLDFLGIKDENTVDSLTIISGFNKSGQKENFDSITINKSEIISIVGPTGSGKSRLLADIEWTANNDTPTGRTILINGDKPDKK